MKETCTICGYGDGKWEERQGTKWPEKLPVCELCKKDGWTIEPKEVVEAIMKDPIFKDKISIASPFRFLKL